jgi:hypothetical protein
MFALRGTNDYIPPKMPKGPGGYRRVLTFDEVLEQMRKDEARAAKVKTTLDRPATALQRGNFNPAMLNALKEEVQEYNEVHRSVQAAHHAAQASTGLPAAAATASAAAVDPSQIPVPDDELGGGVAAKTKKRQRDHGVPIAAPTSPKKTMLKQAARTAMARAAPPRRQIVVTRGGMGSAPQLQIVPMQGVVDVRGEMRTSRGKRDADSIDENPRPKSRAKFFDDRPPLPPPSTPPPEPRGVKRYGDAAGATPQRGRPEQPRRRLPPTPYDPRFIVPSLPPPPPPRTSTG